MKRSTLSFCYVAVPSHLQFITYSQKGDHSKHQEMPLDTTLNSSSSILTLSYLRNICVPLTKSLFKSAGITVSHFFSMLPSTLKYLYTVAAFHTVSFVYGCFAGKCIPTSSTVQKYFKVDGSMEKNWDTVIPADLKRLFVSGTKCPAGHERVNKVPPRPTWSSS